MYRIAIQDSSVKKGDDDEDTGNTADDPMLILLTLDLDAPCLPLRRDHVRLDADSLFVYALLTRSGLTRPSGHIKVFPAAYPPSSPTFLAFAWPWTCLDLPCLTFALPCLAPAPFPIPYSPWPIAYCLFPFLFSLSTIPNPAFLLSYLAPNDEYASNFSIIWIKRCPTCIMH